MALQRRHRGTGAVLYREHLEESFQGTLRFDPIRVELTRNQFDRDASHVTVVYDGGHGLPDPAKLNRISSLMADRAADLGIEDTILESYVHRLEYTGQREFVEGPLEQAGDNSKRWQELLNIAREPLGRRDPSTGTELNLAVDRCYFAAYHALCHSNAQALAGGLRKRRPGEWSRVYTGMDEGIILERLRQYRRQGLRPVRDFGAAFAILQEHRDRAMERPGSTFLPSEVARLIRRAASAVVALEALNAEERRSLAINLLVGGVRGRGPGTGAAPDADTASTG